MCRVLGRLIQWSCRVLGHLTQWSCRILGHLTQWYIDKTCRVLGHLIQWSCRVLGHLTQWYIDKMCRILGHLTQWYIDKMYIDKMYIDKMCHACTDNIRQHVIVLARPHQLKSCPPPNRLLNHAHEEINQGTECRNHVQNFIYKYIFCSMIQSLYTKQANLWTTIVTR
jgi:hypothetical protein